MHFPDHREGYRKLDWEAPTGRVGLRTCPCIIRGLVAPGADARATAWGRPVGEALSQGTLAVVPARLPGPPGERVLDRLTESVQWVGQGRSTAREALQRLNIDDLSRKRCGDLSPRQQRLLALAHGFASRPHTLLLSDWLFQTSDDDQSILLDALLSWDRDWIVTLPAASIVTPRLAESCDRVLCWTSSGLMDQGTSRTHFFLRTHDRSRNSLDRLTQAGLRVRASPNRGWLLVEDITSAELEAALHQTQLTPVAVHVADAESASYCLAAAGPELV